MYLTDVDICNSFPDFFNLLLPFMETLALHYLAKSTTSCLPYYQVCHQVNRSGRPIQSCAFYNVRFPLVWTHWGVPFINSPQSLKRHNGKLGGIFHQSSLNN